MKTGSFVEVDNRKLHFYMQGEGPSLIMLHPSPSTAETLLPLADKLASKYRVFCIDTPGYGKSDALSVNPTSLLDYTSFLHKTFMKLGLNKPSIYGSATGAQLAVRYGLEYPNSVSHIFLDNSAHFDDALADEILEHYFPDLTPQLDGSHLTQIWTIVSQLFQYFPWCFKNEKFALNRPQMPLFVLQLVAMDYLKSGAAYDVAYKLAFQHERGEYVQQLKVPTTIFRWDNSIITRYVDQLLAFKFEDHINAFRIEGDATDRAKKMVAFMNEKAVAMATTEINEGAIDREKLDALTYNKPSASPPKLATDGAHLHLAWNDLIAHNPGASAASVQRYLVDWYSNK